MILTDLHIKAGIAAVCIAAGFSAGAYMTHKYDNGQYALQEQQRQTAEKQAMLDNEKLIAEINKQHNEAIQKAEKEKQNAIQTLEYKYRSAAGQRLYVSASVCDKAGVSSLTDSTTKPDADTAGTVQLPDELAGKLLAEAQRADEVVENYRALQHYLVYVGLYKE